MRTELERFLPKMQVIPDVSTYPGPCWVWTAYTNPKGYGRFNSSVGILAHRWSYTHFVGPIPEGWQIDHLCKYTGCVNPEHLQAVTTHEHAHITKSWEHFSGKTHCPQGHPYEGENLIMWRNKRSCRLCRDARNKARHTKINNKDKTHCKHGHEFTEQNTYYASGGRQCKECRRLRRYNRRNNPTNLE